MKKFMTVALFFAAMFVFAACGSSKDKKSAEATTEEIISEDSKIKPVEMNASEYVELGNYKNLSVDVEKTKVTDADVEEEINNYLEGYAEYQEISDRDTVQKGDYININYSCTIDGKTNDEYSDSDVDIKVGDGEMDEYLGSGLGDDFKVEEKVLGATTGSTVSVSFTFPDDYDDSAVAGKKCDMEVTINEISEEVIPKLDDAFVKEYTESQTVDEYRKEVRKNLEEQAETEAEDMAREKLWNQIVDNSKQKKDFTKEMIEQEIENLKIENQEVAQFYFGVDVEEYIKETTGMGLEDYAEFSLKGQCLQDLLIEEEKISVNDKELKEEMARVAEESGLESADDLSEYYTEDDIRSNLVSKKLFEKLMEYNKVNSIEAKKTDDSETTQTDQESTDAKKN